MRTEAVRFGQFTYRAEQAPKENKNTTPTPVTNPVVENTSKSDTKKKVLPLVSAAVAVASLGVAIYAAKGNGEAKKALEKAQVEGKKIISEAEEKAKKVLEEAESKAKKVIEDSKKNGSGDAIDSKIETLKDDVQKLSSKVEEKQKWNEGYLDGLDKKVQEVSQRPTVVQTTRARNLRHIDGLNLMQNVDNKGERILLSEKTQTVLSDAAPKYMKGIGVTVPALAAGAAVWLPTAESIPEKEGGLGEVPVQMARNMNNELGIDNYIVRPLNEIPGKSTLVETDGQYKYWYQGLKDASGKPLDYMELEKVMDFDVNAMRDGAYETQKIEVFYGIDPANGYKRIMFRNPDYFKSAGLYRNSATASEPERYNFFSKLVYEFAKIKADPKAMTSYHVYDQQLFDDIKAPDAMILNDWHTAPVAALMRLKAPVEAENKELSQSVAKTFADMNLMYIVHNSDYQGWGGEYSSDMLNTLFDKYAYDIYKYAGTGFTEKVKQDDGEIKEKSIDALKSVLTINGSVNMANMGMALATKVKPVSPTYAKELATDAARSGALMHISETRLGAGTMAGQSNGWDRLVNEVSVSQLQGFNGNLNKDKFTIFSYVMNDINGLTDEQNKAVKAVLKTPNMNNYAAMIEKLENLNIPRVTETLNKLKEAGITELRTFKPETADMDTDAIMAARKHNKRMLFEHLKAMVDFNKKEGKEVFNVKAYGLTDLSDINPDELDEVPFYNMGVRFVGQKGVDIAAGAWERILNNWETLYPDKKRPVVIMGGADAESGKYRKILLETNERLQDKGVHLYQMDGFVPNNILMAGSDWTMRPSYFEPDGDKFESLYKGTPVVLTRVGGHVDSVQDGFNGILTSRTMKDVRDALTRKGLPHSDENITSELIDDYTEALKRTLDIFYSKTGQKQLVDNAIHCNQSWVQKDAEGKIVECPLIGHLRDLGFNLGDFYQVSDSVSGKKSK